MQQGGTFAPGKTNGITTLDGDYELSAGEVEFGISGVTRGDQYVGLNITGQGTFNGTIKVVLKEGFSPAVGDSFQLDDAQIGISGTPSFDFSEAVLSSGQWDTSSFLSDGTITVVANSNRRHKKRRQ